jgi:hypothetical protein
MARKITVIKRHSVRAFGALRSSADRQLTLGPRTTKRGPATAYR